MANQSRELQLAGARNSNLLRLGKRKGFSAGATGLPHIYCATFSDVRLVRVDAVARAVDGVLVIPGSSQACICADGSGSLYLGNLASVVLDRVDIASFAPTGALNVVGSSYEFSVCWDGHQHIAKAMLNADVVAFVDIPTFNVDHTYNLPAGSRPLGTAWDGANRVYFTNYGGASVGSVRTDTWTLDPLIPLGVVSPDGIAWDGKGHMWVCCISGDVLTIDTTTRVIDHIIVMPAAPYGIAFDGSGDTAFISHYAAGVVSRIDVATFTPIPGLLPVGLLPYPMCWDGGSGLYVGNAGSNDISVVDIPSWVVAATIPLVAAPYGLVANF